jgi:23S rRNA (cytidine1920-2'-O)/16S rRNA (cytidine1409-2'-O)-methyltransferase
MRRRLDAELVRRGLVGSRQGAVEAISGGRVLVAGAPAQTPARQVGDDEPIRVVGPPPRFVSRGGEKLAGALDRLGVRVDGERVLDAGASTGGFTDCLLQRGAMHVVAVDVGRGQLAWSLRTDPRVTVLERVNVRHLEPDVIGGPVPRCTADLSFISLGVCAPALARCTTSDADLVLLVKPQFEAGPRRVGRGGIVRDPAVHRTVLGEVRDRLGESGLVAVGVTPSSPRGADGNVEFFFHARKAGPGVGDAALDAAVAAAQREDGGAADRPSTSPGSRGRPSPPEGTA